ncbi:MAG: FAD-dependent oxidoreductase [Acholeplasmataceae bacterium]|nr:FAD-dependent oxidoreductase [Acholeplasmataceae bacterium]MDD4194038.1 FAD-dependent oxidoreductase [Acholeplasmataceae bacterium]
MKTNLLVIGGGAAGMAAAVSASNQGFDILVVERDRELGGILNQCIHNGFGLKEFKEELTGPEYASRFMNQLDELKIPYLLSTTVLDIVRKDHFTVKCSSVENGLFEIEADAVILSTGCYERTRGAILLPGERPKGIMTAGSAQRYLNKDGYLVGKNVFILGSGDIGLIMARRMTLEGAKVHGVAEIMPFSNGLTRNVVQCLHDFDIPLYLSHTVTDIRGKERLEGITIQQVDEKFQVIPNTEKSFDVDTLLLSVGLIPDVTLFDSLTLEIDPITKSVVVDQNYETNIPGLFACGNSLHVHDLVDEVSNESKKAGEAAIRYLKFDHQNKKTLMIEKNENVRYVVPQTIAYNQLEVDHVELSFRVTKKIAQATIQVMQGDEVIQTKKARYLAPAEMLRIAVPKDKIQSDKDLVLAVKEV